MDKFLMNRMANSSNRWQGKFKRVLCVCSAGLLRSPTAAFVLSGEPYNYNTRAAGLTKEFALIPVDEVLIEWADEIVCMNLDQKMALENMTDKPVFSLDIQDEFEYRDPGLIKIIKFMYNELIKQGAVK